VVVVTVDYRLGVLGFFAHSSLTAEDPANTGNQGLLDQRAALQWVRKNIAAFRGDPSNVTIFGVSAGGYDVCLHVVSPGSRGLFHRAIGESPETATGHGATTTPGGSDAGLVGACTSRLWTSAEAEAVAERVIATVGCAGASDVLACLRRVSVADLLDAAGPDFVLFVDGNVIPDQPRTLIAAGEFVKVPHILGSNSDEGTLFFLGFPPVTTETEYLAALGEMYGDLAGEVAAVYPASAFAAPQDALVRTYGDSAFVCAAYDHARRAAAAGARVRLYNFARPVPIPELEPLKLGTTHGLEIHYLFRGLTPPTAIDDALSRAMQGYWTRFARAGDPNGEGALLWPLYDEATDQRLSFDAELSVVSGFRRPECELWWEVYDREFE
jgi:para-nitrobenzyl esterase